MVKKCYRCGSERLTRLVPAGALVVPEISEAVAEGLAEVVCNNDGFMTGYRTRCEDCGFEWTPLMEKRLEAEKKSEIIKAVDIPRASKYNEYT